MTLLVQGFLLGLANGASCLTTCAPVLLPYLVGEGRTVRRNALPVLHFLGGRQAGYLIFAVFAWEAGQWIRASPQGGLIFGAVYATLAIVLVIYGFSSPANTCAAGSMALTAGEAIKGRTPFCHMVIPATIIFPGSILGSYSIASMIVLWLGAILAMGRGCCPICKEHFGIEIPTVARKQRGTEKRGRL